MLLQLCLLGWHSQRKKRNNLSPINITTKNSNRHSEELLLDSAEGSEVRVRMSKRLRRLSKQIPTQQPLNSLSRTTVGNDFF